MNDFVFRDATLTDIPFLVETIIEAEKSGTDKLTYSTIFGLSEEDSKKYIAEMFLEEINGCELSVSSFLLAEFDGQTVAAVSAWIEGIEGIPSSVLKGNLLSYLLPAKCIERAILVNPIISDLHIDYVPNSIQIGSVYVVKSFRGNNILGLLITNKIIQLLQIRPNISVAYVQIFECNLPSIKAHEKLNFKQIMLKTSPNEEILRYLPFNKKILMKKELLTK